MTLNMLIEDLKLHGGAIVSSAACSPMEISYARLENRIVILEDGCGFVRRPQGWIDALAAIAWSPLVPPRDPSKQLQEEVRRLRAENALAYEALTKLQEISNRMLEKRRAEEG